MRKAPLVAAINDLSGFGHCSLTAALPILSVMGFQCCPLPTAVFSNHTGYDSCYCRDFTDDMPAYFAEWQKLNLQFAGVYTGFLGSAAQVDIVSGIIRKLHQEDSLRLVLVDPVLGDNGKAYSACDATLCGSMKKLVAQADVITPNITEACMMLGREYCGEKIDEAEALKIVKDLAALGAGKVVLTGVRSKPNTVANLAFDTGLNHFYWVEEPLVKVSFAGAGDVFASVLCGSLLAGQNMQEALEKAAFFVYLVAKNTAAAGGSARDGLDFEPYLKML